MKRTLVAKPLNDKDFEPFGQVIEKRDSQAVLINKDKCTRFHDLAHVDISASGRPIINIFQGTHYPLPLELTLVERHPLGSQAFVPMSDKPFLVVVFEDEDGVPVRPRAFVTSAGQGVNYAKNTWHAVLTPLYEDADFCVVDYGGDELNLEEYVFDQPYLVALET